VSIARETPAVFSGIDAGNVALKFTECRTAFNAESVPVQPRAACRTETLALRVCRKAYSSRRAEEGRQRAAFASTTFAYLVCFRRFCFSRRRTERRFSQATDAAIMPMGFVRLYDDAAAAAAVASRCSANWRN